MDYSKLKPKVNHIRQEFENITDFCYKNGNSKGILEQIDEWEAQSVKHIHSSATEARERLKQLISESKAQTDSLHKKFSSGIATIYDNELNEANVEKLEGQLEQFRNYVIKLLTFEFIQLFTIRTPMIKVKLKAAADVQVNSAVTKSIVNSKSPPVTADDRKFSHSPGSSGTNSYKPARSTVQGASKTLETTTQSYPAVIFNVDSYTHKKVIELFKTLTQLEPMNKNGPMSGRCHEETTQMENFLKETFGFKNIEGKHIVHGVRAFQLKQLPTSMDKNKIIEFPGKGAHSFKMSIDEIIEWQKSYRVYADKIISGMTKEFLQSALQGGSHDGEEAFRMKFVVRISTCPILMEFDAKIIRRELNESWPNNIKLVSVTGIDFAGRKHDVHDILYYIANWKDVFYVDKTNNLPQLANERDFAVRRDHPLVEISQSRLLNDLKSMARLRLLACDNEGVEVVVETGIGLGVFAGSHIGIDHILRITSAIAIRTVLENEGSSFKHIRAVVFALPVFDIDYKARVNRDVFSEFVEQFQQPLYKGPIPVLLADQDMHRLTVAIARLGFVVSELNPADSHGVFGEYWQNRGPAVEEKLALTTVGLLVQHHLINEQVLNTNNYNLLIDNRIL